MMLKTMASRIAALLRRRQLDEELDDEIGTHLEMAEEQYLASGMSPEAARLAARRDFGGVGRVKEQHRDVRTIAWLENLIRDLRIGARGLRKRPGFGATVVLALSLGIGLPSLTFSLVNSAVLARLPFEGADRIVSMERPDRAPVTAQDYAIWSSRQRSFEAGRRQFPAKV